MVTVDEDYLDLLDGLWAEVGKAAAQDDMIREEKLMYVFVGHIPTILAELRRLWAASECEWCGSPMRGAICSGTCDNEE